MANVPDSDAEKVVEWVSQNIPEDVLAGDGYERHIHTTVLYGFPDTFDYKKIWNGFLKDWDKRLKLKLGKIKRFPASKYRPDSDVLVVEVSGQVLVDMHYALRKRYPSVKVTYPDYKPHLTLAYVKPGTCKDLDGHAFFDGWTIPVPSLVYSVSDRSHKPVFDLS